MYKFYSFNENNVTAFQNYSAWFSKPNVFNDPFEGIYVDDTADLSNEELISFCQNNKNNKQFLDAFKINGDVDDWMQRLYIYNKIDAFKDDLKRRNINILKTIQKKFYNSGICCFIMDVESNPISNNLMWGHYGNGLQGYAVEVIDTYKNVFESSPIFSDVSYEDTPPRINAVKIMMGMIKDDSDNISDESLILSLKIMNTKHTHWGYENELRFISAEHSNELIKYQPGAIKSLFIGERMPHWQKVALYHIAKEHNIENIYEAYANRDSYSVGIKSFFLK